MRSPELTYANPADPWLRRTLILRLEQWAGRDTLLPLYETWRRDIVPGPGPVIRPMLDLLRIDVRIEGAWPPSLEATAPVVLVANHPYGIADGIAALSLAEALGRPAKVLINKELMKVPEIRPFSLPVDFAPTREAQAANVRMRAEAIAFLRSGGTVVVFPAGGVATAPSAFGRAVDLPWKTFVARLVQASHAQVLPVWFHGQCSPLFHVASRIGLTLRLALMIAELCRLIGGRLVARVGGIVAPCEIATIQDRLALTKLLYQRVHAMSGYAIEDSLALAELLPAYLIAGEP